MLFETRFTDGELEWTKFNSTKWDGPQKFDQTPFKIWSIDGVQAGQVKSYNCLTYAQENHHEPAFSCPTVFVCLTIGSLFSCFHFCLTSVLFQIHPYLKRNLKETFSPCFSILSTQLNNLLCFFYIW